MVRGVRAHDLWNAVSISLTIFSLLVFLSILVLTPKAKYIYRYDSFTPVLKQARFQARMWCHRYNNQEIPPTVNSFDSLVEYRSKMLREILGSIKDGGSDEEAPVVEPPFTVDYGVNIAVGTRFYANFNATIVDSALVTFGDRVLMGPNVSILTATHETEIQSRRDNIEYARAITIGDDCWIGGNVVILPGVHIGKGCTIGAGAVVTKNIADFSVAVGNPARVIKTVTPL